MIRPNGGVGYFGNDGRNACKGNPGKCNAQVDLLHNAHVVAVSLLRCGYVLEVFDHVTEVSENDLFGFVFSYLPENARQGFLYTGNQFGCTATVVDLADLQVRPQNDQGALFCELQGFQCGPEVFDQLDEW